MENLKTVRGMWICASENGTTQPHTISYTKKDCIRKMIIGSTMTWKEFREYGWVCVKVNIIFDVI